jgi:hypothetical protein
VPASNNSKQLANKRNVFNTGSALMPEISSWLSMEYGYYYTPPKESYQELALNSLAPEQGKFRIEPVDARCLPIESQGQQSQREAGFRSPASTSRYRAAQGISFVFLTKLQRTNRFYCFSFGEWQQSSSAKTRRGKFLPLIARCKRLIPLPII